MNRRDFFKSLAAGAALSAGGIALIEPAKTFFLPPPGGWRAGYKIREVRQYLIADDTMPLRYDMAWDRLDGSRVQYNVTFPPIDVMDLYPGATGRVSQLDSMRQQAVRLFEQKMREEDLYRFENIELPLPRGIEYAQSLVL